MTFTPLEASSGADKSSSGENRFSTGGLLTGFKHLPVMAEEGIKFLEGESGGIDRDEEAIEAAQERLKCYPQRVDIVRDNFANMKRVMEDLGIKSADGILLDLGVSSHHFESRERGFSFRLDAPLDMRMDKRQEKSAYHIVNKLSMEELKGILWEYGEGRGARKIAKAVVEKRRYGPIATTQGLSNLISSAIPKKFHPKDIHPATRTFQAIRIAVNDELNNLEKAVNDGVDLLARNGRMVIISFHSLEDRIVKESFRKLERGCICPHDFPKCVCGRKPKLKIITRKPVIPSLGEIEKNPRARSAKLRAAERL